LSSSSSYRANGKLLLTGEYLVLHGAKAIALPLKVGQSLTISELKGLDSLVWRAFYEGKVWFSCELNPTDFSILETSHPDKAETLRRIFRTIKNLNPEFSPKAGTVFETTLEANPEWGFGSSSTLISLLSQWAKVDQFALNEMVFKGSGFDIACATAEGPIFYVRNSPPEPIALDYPFADQLFLVYSGEKKKTDSEVSSFLKEKTVQEHLIYEMTALSEAFAICREQNELNRLIIQHERLIAAVIGKTPVKSEYFADFDGEIKSLGAWGGDFYLVSTNRSFSGVKEYFENKGLNTLFRWDDLILKRQIS
jgi:mevalonate kinase